MAAEAAPAEALPLHTVAAPPPAARRTTEQALSFLHEEIPAEREGRRAAPLMAAEGLPPELPPHAVSAPPPAESAVERRRRLDRVVQLRRRRRVAALYAQLRAMLPSLPISTRRVTMEEVLIAAAARVKELEDTAAALEAYRGGAPPRPVGGVAVCPGTVTVSARMPAVPEPAGGGALRRVVEAFERRGARVLVAAMARHGGAGGGELVVTATANGVAPEVVEMIRADIARIN